VEGTGGFEFVDVCEGRGRQRRVQTGRVRGRSTFPTVPWQNSETKKESSARAALIVTVMNLEAEAGVSERRMVGGEQREVASRVGWLPKRRPSPRRRSRESKCSASP
jgi:hypothetical protein